MKLLPFAIGGLGGGFLLKKLFHTPSVPQQPAPVTTMDARDQALRQDELLRRRGGAADIVTGDSGAEASPGSTGKTTLGS